MDKNITLTARQIVYLGKLFKATKIDYVYISAAGSKCLEHFSFVEPEIRNELMLMGLLSESFDGSISVSDELIPLMKTLFDGRIEATVDVIDVGSSESVQMYKYYINNENVVEVHNVGALFAISSVDKAHVNSIADGLVDKNYQCNEVIHLSAFDNNKISQIISVKNVVFGEESKVKTFIMSDGVYYQENVDDVISAVSRNYLVESISSMLTEVM